MVRLIRIHSGKSMSAAFVSVKYRNNWFWIDEGDLESKQVFSIIMMLFTMVDTGPKREPASSHNSCALMSQRIERRGSREQLPACTPGVETIVSGIEAQAAKVWRSTLTNTQVDP